MKKIIENVKKTLLQRKECIKNQKGEVGVGTVLAIVLVLIIFAFVVVPQARSFVGGMFTDLASWYKGLNLFPTA